MAHSQGLNEENYGKWLEREITLQRKDKSSKKKQQYKQPRDVFITEKQITKRILKKLYAQAFKQHSLRKRNQLNAKLNQNTAYEFTSTAAAASSNIMYETCSDDDDECIVPLYDWL